jgi:hypothetical protein
MRRLGVTKENLLRHMRAMEADGELPETADDLDMSHAARIGGCLLTENADARCEADQARADWSAFFAAVLAFIVQLMPYIIKARAKLLTA